MPRTLSDQEWANLQADLQIANFTRSIWDDPALSKDAKALAKRKYPQLQIPDFDLENKLDERLAEERRIREDQERARQEQEEDKRVAQLRKDTQDRYGVTEDGMRDLESFMRERNIGDYEVAASFKFAKSPKSSDPTFGDGFWNHEKQQGFAEIAKDPEGWGRNEILKAIHADQARERNGR